MKHVISFLTLSALSLAGSASAAITPVWSTGVAVPGEKVMLYLVDPDVGEDMFMVSRRPTVDNAHMELQQPRAGANTIDPKRGTVEVYPILLEPDAAGQLKPSDITVKYQSGREETIAIPALPVVSTSEIHWNTTPLPYGVLWHTEKKDGYVDQSLDTTMKVFLPADCESLLPPQLHSVGVRIEGFQTALQGAAAQVQSMLLPETEAFAKGQMWRTADFRGSLTPFREGKSAISGKLTFARRQSIFSVARVEADVPPLELAATPLPPNAPADFNHAVGQYRISAATKAEQLSMNEPVEVDITVTGTGGFDQIECPAPVNAEAWKLIPATKKPLLGANGEVTGLVFSQLMRPTAEVSAIPEFAFSYFDPQEMEYVQASTKPMALKWVQSETAGSGHQSSAAEPPPAGEIPVAQMTDIYGFLTPDEVGTPLNLPRGLAWLLYLPALLILGITGGRALARKLAEHRSKHAEERALNELEAAPDALSFLKGIGGYIESHLPESARTPELQAILDRRDTEAYRPDAGTALTPTEKHAMMKHLRRAIAKLSLLAAALILPILPEARADGAQANYEAGQYSQALTQLTQAAPSSANKALNLYNQGCCEYRLGHSGKAALCFARALRADSGLREARANLEFIQRKEGAILPNRLSADEVFTFLTPSQLRLATLGSTALLALGGSLLIAYRRRDTPWLNAGTALAALASLLCAFDWLYYETREVPDFGLLSPESTAMVLDRTELRTGADAKGSVILTLTPSTPLHLLAKRGAWCYAETATGVRGWVGSAAIEALGHQGAPDKTFILRF